MRVIKWVVGLLALALVTAFLHYVLPKHAVVYVTSTENRIVSPGEVRGFRSLGDAAADAQGRAGTDVFFINTTQRNGRPLVFRNEDTGFGFPWYLKFDSANLQAEAQDAVSTRDNPRWVIMRYYGWRIPFLSMFPNAVSMRVAPSPDVRPIPWFTIGFLIVLLAVIWAVWARIRRWRRRRAAAADSGWDVPLPRKGWFR
jgi:hypothetical protein